MVGRLSRTRATLATATAHCCSSNRLRTRKAHDRSKVYQPTASAAMRRHNDQPPNAACASPTRRTEGLSNRIPFSFVRPALVVLRLLFSVCSPSPPKARALVCPPTPGRLPAPAGKNRGAPESAKRRDTFLPFTERRGSAGRSRTRIWRAKAPTAICGFESSSGNPRTRNASAPETPSSTTSKATPRCLASKRSSPPRRLHWEPLRSQASPTGLGFAPGPRPRCRDNTTTRAQVWRRPLSYGRAPTRGSTPPLPMQRSATPSPTRGRFTPAPGLKTTAAFRPWPPANALRLRRPVAVLRRRQSAAQLYAVVDLYTAIWFVTRMRRLTGADSAQHDLLTISRTWISASVSSEQWGHVSQWRRRRAAASRGI